MRVLVTGGAGFIGSHTVDNLVARGAEVMVVDDLSTGKPENVNPRAVFVEMDIASGELSAVFDRFRPEAVIHLAAQVSVAKSIADPVRDSMINVVGCVNLLENCRRVSVDKVVYASSAAVYGDPREAVLAEDIPTRPLSFYGVSKLAPEYYLKVFHHLYGLKYTVLRYANVYGPRQDAAGEGGVVAIFATRILAGQSPVIYGDGEQTRDFIYVKDVAEANVAALTGGDRHVLNIGTGVGTSVNRLFYTMAGLAGRDMRPVYAEPREGDIRHSCMDNSLARAVLDWEPKFGLEEGLAGTLDYYRG